MMLLMMTMPARDDDDADADDEPGKEDGEGDAKKRCHMRLDVTTYSRRQKNLTPPGPNSPQAPRNPKAKYIKPPQASFPEVAAIAESSTADQELV